jgi:hypothetical protein
MEAHPEEEEPTSVGRKSDAVQQREVPNEDAVVKPVKGRKKRLRGKKQAAGRRREPKKLTRGNCGSRMQLAAACRKVYRRATVAWRKRIIFRKSSTQRNCRPRKKVTAAGIKITRCAGHRRMEKKEGNAEQETPKRTEENRCSMYPEYNTGIRDRGLKQRLRVSNQLKDLTKNAIEGCRLGQRLHIGGRRTHKKTYYETVREKIAKRIVGSFVGLRQNKDWNLWRGRPPPRRKKTLQAEEEPVT